MEYDVIASDYDRFNGGFDYADYLDRILPYFVDLPAEKLALDCGCGTGSLMAELTRRGFDCTGIDASEEMLDVAFEKLSAASIAPHLICQSLPDIDLYGAYHAVFSSMDTLNHLLDKRELKRFFRRLFCFVEPGGYVAFDLKTRDMFSKIQPQICEEDGKTLLLRGTFDGTYAEYRLTSFSPDGDRFRRSEEVICERYYPYETVREIVTDAGFRVLKKFSYKGRIVVILRRMPAECTVRKESEA